MEDGEVWFAVAQGAMGLLVVVIGWTAARLAETVGRLANKVANLERDMVQLVAELKVEVATLQERLRGTQ
tara:strand:- start:189 stop:398 length:210 start_codon:yes stop_codon:yes gene_type:complete